MRNAEKTRGVDGVEDLNEFDQPVSPDDSNFRIHSSAFRISRIHVSFQNT